MSQGDGAPKLPARTIAGPDGEDAFVARLRDGDGERGPADDAELLDAIDHAIAARRPQLAARLFQLLDDSHEIVPGSALERAHQASRFLVRPGVDSAAASWSELDDAWAEARRSRMDRIKRRWRQQLSGDTSRIGRYGRGRTRS